LRIGISGLGYGLGQSGGLQVYLRELLRALAEADVAGHEYVVVGPALGETPPLPASPRFSLVRLSAPPPRRRFSELVRVPLGLPPAPHPLAAEIDGLGLDLLHFATTRMPALDLRTPVVLTFFDMQEEFLPGFFPWRERIGRALAHRRGVRQARVVLVPSQFTADTLTARYKTPAEKIALAPVGVADRFGPQGQAGERRRLESRYGLPALDFALYPANPWPHKNHARLLAALRRLREQRFLVVPLVCTGRLEGEVRSVAALARAAGLPPDQVCELGFVAEEDMPALYRASRLLVFPSLYEGFGIPVLEAMASGCPVACARATSLPEVGADAVQYFDPLDAEEIAEALAEVWTDEARRADLVRRGEARAEGLRWPRVIPRVLTAYDQVALARTTAPAAAAAAGKRA
jgi:glycosyltransferase involved in cell wall biosynthesis